MATAQGGTGLLANPTSLRVRVFRNGGQFATQMAPRIPDLIHGPGSSKDASRHFRLRALAIGFGALNTSRKLFFRTSGIKQWVRRHMGQIERMVLRLELYFVR